MERGQEKGTEKQVETAEMGWLAKTRSFLEIPNPAIVKVSVISSSATFTSGIAFAFEWLFHGRSHIGFGWIIYYALFLISLPLLLLIGLRILMAISCSSRGSSSQIVDSIAAAAAKEPCAEEAQQTEETEKNSCRSLAVVVDSDERKMNRDEKTLKRAVSFPSHGKIVTLLTMDRQAENVPSQTSFVLSTQFPCPPSGQNRGSMPPPRRSSLPPLPPKRPTTTTTTRHQQIGLQNFNPGPRLLPPQSPVFRSWTPMSSPAPSSSFQYLQSAPPVAYHNAALPPRPPTTSVSARGSAYSGNDSAVFPSMDAMKMIYPEPIEMPVGVNYSKEGHGEPAGFMDEQVYMDLDEIFDFSTKDDDVARIGSGSSENNKRNAGVKKRAAPSRKTRRKSVSPSVDCNNLNNWKSSVAIEKGMFTESQMNEIARSKTLQKYVVTDPKYAKRMLSNREGARRSVKRTAQHILNLEEKVQTLEKEGVTLTVHTSFAEKKKLGLEEENKQLRIRLHEIQDQSKRANASEECNNEEINWVKQKGTEEVFPDWDTTMDEFLLEQLNELNEEPETNNCGFE
ncbi:hypothetical protein Bca4012_096334 [Brassica carinata]